MERPSLHGCYYLTAQDDITLGIVRPRMNSDFIVDAVYFVDAMSTFGAVPINMVESNIDFMVSSSNKCIEGIPGFSYAIANKKKLLACKGNDFL